MKFVHCQWADLRAPSGYQVISKDPMELSESERAGVEIYIPKYMGAQKPGAQLLVFQI